MSSFICSIVNPLADLGQLEVNAGMLKYYFCYPGTNFYGTPRPDRIYVVGPGSTTQNRGTIIIRNEETNTVLATANITNPTFNISMVSFSFTRELWPIEITLFSIAYSIPTNTDTPTFYAVTFIQRSDVMSGLTVLGRSSQRFVGTLGNEGTIFPVFYINPMSKDKYFGERVRFVMVTAKNNSSSNAIYNVESGSTTAGTTSDNAFNLAIGETGANYRLQRAGIKNPWPDDQALWLTSNIQLERRGAFYNNVTIANDLPKGTNMLIFTPDIPVRYAFPLNMIHEDIYIGIFVNPGTRFTGIVTRVEVSIFIPIEVVNTDISISSLIGLRIADTYARATNISGSTKMIIITLTVLKPFPEDPTIMVLHMISGVIPQSIYFEYK